VTKDDKEALARFREQFSHLRRFKGEEWLSYMLDAFNLGRLTGRNQANQRAKKWKR